MNFQFYIEKLKDSKEYQKFIKENKKSYLCTGFFVIDIEGANISDKQHLDFYNPEKNEVISFQLEENCQKVPVEQKDQETPTKLDENLNLDFDEVVDEINKKFEKKNIDKKIQKILLSLQNIDDKEFLIGTIFITGMGLVKLHFDIQQNKITEFEKKSFFDMMNFMKNKNKEDN